jgi:hypothetical protein
MPLSPQIFRAAFNRFQAIHRQKCGFELDTFRNPDSFAFQTEDYKEDIAREAARILDSARWTRAELGRGAILDRVIRAIELRGNNLLSWQPRYGPGSEIHASLVGARRSVRRRRELEMIFWQLYRENHANEATFAALTNICGNRYELLGYLFFIADRHRFLPIRTTWFDRFLAELGISVKTRGQCGWNNYELFLASMRDVRSQLRAEGIHDATLLDAHSFGWILARFPLNSDGASPAAPRIQGRMFSGSLKEAEEDGTFTPTDDAPMVNMQVVNQSCAASGQIAEDVAIRHERERLREAGWTDLSERVESVSDRPALGYDIQSFEGDGTPRYIEVKNVSGGNRFFLSSHEWKNSRSRPNYWFYLVSGVDTGRPTVTFLRATTVQQRHLQSIQYMVRFGA